MAIGPRAHIKGMTKVFKSGDRPVSDRIKPHRMHEARVNLGMI